MLGAGLFDNVAVEAQASSTLSAVRAALLQAVERRLGADSAAIVDPVGRVSRDGEDGRIVGLGTSANYKDQFLANQHRYAKSFARFMGVIQNGPAVDTDIYGHRDRLRLSVYAELFVPQRARSILASCVAYRGRSLAIIVLKRHGRSTPFRQREVEALRSLLPAIALADAGFQYSFGAPALVRAHDVGCQALTPRETQVAQLACKGMRNAEIAALLGTSRDTVKKQLGSVFGKVNVSNRTELAMLWAHSDEDAEGSNRQNETTSQRETGSFV